MTGVSSVSWPPPKPETLRAMAREASVDQLMREAAVLRDAGHGRVVTYSRKVFIPLTKLCRDTCRYCTFAEAPRNGAAPYLTPEEVIAIARAGEAAGCKEALFTLGDKPEMRWSAARDELTRLGYKSTIHYLAAMCRLVLEETRLLPHANPGVMSQDEVELLRMVTASQGLMLESTSQRLLLKGGAHQGSPDKDPAERLRCIEAAGKCATPFTSGILIGIGETEEERIDALLALRDLHHRYGHIQEIIVQNFRAKPRTAMAQAPEPSEEELLRGIALARIAFGPEMAIQAPPNLSPGKLERLLAAGLNDWGGVSPVTVDHVNPEAPWPNIDELSRLTAKAGKVLVERTAIHPSHVQDAKTWLDPRVLPRVLAKVDSDGLARTDEWTVGSHAALPTLPTCSDSHLSPNDDMSSVLSKLAKGEAPDERDLVELFKARGADFQRILVAADTLRRATVGDVVTYVVNRNINYTNICQYRCGFCAFAKGRRAAALRGPAYDLSQEEIARRVREAWERGATEVCMQGGIHPSYTGRTYLEILNTAKKAVPQIHVHAFSPLEVKQGASTLGFSVEAFLTRLRDAGLGSLPGTAAEILDDEVRRVLCPDKLSADEWVEIVSTAHSVGLKSTSTIMFGHVDRPVHWARHLLRIRALAQATGGITEFVPLPFVHHEAPIALRGAARFGPTFREAILMHAVARIALHPYVRNIQASWVKLGPDGARLALAAGVNDLGGVLMNESISRAAGSTHGQEMPVSALETLILNSSREPRQRTTLYGAAPECQVERSWHAPPLIEVQATA
ncbi:5-amino-6-(D-ribitylamino)uracil--L-tyrosine 4-hydroxyphenyl transferase CofH [Bradyrhizobium ottawaense]|uniref:5-amino-6-(D-ribitylamino)uracil--L-tyrosine 4-hydroxyphenyl transferase CofH n=1 Tax=Bradyrhizobium ottawaense TaxID=931866 RepID=UPI0038339446